MVGKNRKDFKERIQCGSCGRNANQVKLILKSPHDNSSFFCNICLDLMHEIIDESWKNKSEDKKDTAAEQSPGLTDNMAILTKTTSLICQWCGQQICLERRAIASPSFHICYECICNLYHPTNSHTAWKELNKG
jgi:hypothetical protein